MSLLRSTRRPIILCMAIFACCGGVAVFNQEGPPSASASSPSLQNSRRGVPSPWIVLGRPHGERVVIGRGVDWCPPEGRPEDQPRFVGVKEVDTPRAVILTAYLLKQPPETCLGVVAQVQRTVRIPDGLHGRRLFDGSTSPATQRWPRRPHQR